MFVSNESTPYQRRKSTPLPPRVVPTRVPPLPIPERSPAGQKYVVTSEKRDLFLSKIRLGHTYEDACRLAGFSTAIFERWMKRGEASSEDDPDEPYFTFAQQVRLAESEAIDAAMQALVNHFDKDWRAAEKFLSRKRRAEWGEKDDKPQQAQGAQVVIVMPSNGRDVEPPQIVSNQPAAIDVSAQVVE